MFLLGLALLALSLPPFFSFPLLGFWLLPLGGTYLLLLLVLPRLWLVVLPIATVLLDITPWTGRFIYNEFDFLFLLTLASGFFYNRYRFKVYTPSPAILLLACYLAVTALGYSGWLTFFMPPQSGWGNPYYTEEYGYKVVKGLLWGIALVPMWGYLLAVDKQRSINWLMSGMTLAAFCLGLVVLWERGTLGVLFAWSAWYHVVSSLLDLSSSYRVTALFSDMHTGGEVIDGVLLLMLPVTLHAITWGKSVLLRLLGVLGVLALAYVTLVGFTRTTYAAFVFESTVFALLMLWYRNVAGLPLAFPLRRLVITLVSAVLAAVLAYRFAGSYGLASFGLLLFFAYISSRFTQTRTSLAILGLLAACALALALNAHLSSRWVERSIIASVLLVITLTASLLVALPLFRHARDMSELNRLILLGVCLMVPTILAFSLGGYQISNRMTHASADLATRGNHWGDVVDSQRAGVWHQLVGSGVGTFPSRYVATHPDKGREIAMFSVPRDDDTTVLRLVGGQASAQSEVMGQIIGQRVRIEPHTNYIINLRFRAADTGNLVVALCQRNLLYASNFTPPCVHEKVSFEGDEAFQEVEVQIDSGRIGSRGALSRWPTLLTLGHRRAGQVLEIDSIQFSPDGFNLLRNSSFKHGMNYWFNYDDFSHLPWHVKNTFLLVWFETGWLGLGIFVALITMLVHKTFQRHSVDSLAPVYLTGVLTICVFGLFGSPLDSARVSWIFYFFLAAGLASLRVRKRAVPRTTPRQ